MKKKTAPTERPKTEDLVLIDPAFSIGTHFAIETLIEMLEDKDDKTDTILINIGTLIRNRQPDTSVKTISNEIQAEVGAIREHLARAASNGNKNNVTVVFYIVGDYKVKIPVDLLRPTTESRQQYDMMVDNIIKTYRKKGNRTNYKNIVVAYAPLVGFQLPYIQLIAYAISIPTTRTIALITHMPMDFHLMNRFRSAILVESHTGAMKDFNDLGIKVFKNEHLPFYKATHEVLGDKELFKSCLTTSEKKLMFELAEKEKWQLKTNDGIRSAIKNRVRNEVPFKLN